MGWVQVLGQGCRSESGVKFDGRNVEETFHTNRERGWLMTATDCFPLEVGKTGLGFSKLAGQKRREPTGTSCSTATKLKTPGVITSEFPHECSTRQSYSAGGSKVWIVTEHFSHESGRFDSVWSSKAKADERAKFLEIRGGFAHPDWTEVNEAEVDKI